MRPRVYVTRKMIAPGMEMIRSLDVVVHEGDGPPSREELLRNVKGKDGLVCYVSDRIDREVLDGAADLKVISTFSVGLEHIDVGEATKRGIYVGYTPGVLTDATADLAFALLLGAARRIIEAERLLRQRRSGVVWSPEMLLGRDLPGKTLGIIGLGRIGKAVARRARGFDMQILYTDGARLPDEEEKALGVSYVSLEELLKASDFVTIHTPLTETTRHLMNEERLGLMKPTAYLINTSRGGTVDERALVKALKEGWIEGAALDVYEKEPVDDDNPLFDLDNVLMVPHIGSATREARSRMAEITATNLLNVLRGEPPLHWVNPEVEKIRPLSAVGMR